MRKLITILAVCLAVCSTSSVARAAILLGDGEGYATAGGWGAAYDNTWYDATPAALTTAPKTLWDYSTTFPGGVDGADVTYSNQVTGGLVSGSTPEDMSFSGQVISTHEQVSSSYESTDTVWYGSPGLVLDVELTTSTDLTYNIQGEPTISNGGTYIYGFGMYEGWSWDNSLSDTFDTEDTSTALDWTYTNTLEPGKYRFETWSGWYNKNDWKDAANSTMDYTFDFEAVPEPGSVIIWLGLGTIGLSGWRRRRGRQKS